jgi:hypothetical protein
LYGDSLGLASRRRADGEWHPGKPSDNPLEASEGIEKVVWVLGLDSVEVLDGLTAGLDGGGEGAGFLGLADIVVGVADAGPEDIIDRIGVAFGNPQFLVYD